MSFPDIPEPIESNPPPGWLKALCPAWFGGAPEPFWPGCVVQLKGRPDQPAVVVEHRVGEGVYKVRPVRSPHDTETALALGKLGTVWSERRVEQWHSICHPRSKFVRRRSRWRAYSIIVTTMAMMVSMSSLLGITSEFAAVGLEMKAAKAEADRERASRQRAEDERDATAEALSQCERTQRQCCDALEGGGD